MSDWLQPHEWTLDFPLNVLKSWLIVEHLSGKMGNLWGRIENNIDALDFLTAATSRNKKFLILHPTS